MPAVGGPGKEFWVFGENYPNAASHDKKRADLHHLTQVCFALTLILSAMVASEQVLLEVEVSVCVVV